MTEALRNLQPELRQLVNLSWELTNREHRLNSHWLDYGFLLFPAAKAYEGFLKLFLLQLRLITQDQYASQRFRIGRSLNPDLVPSQRDEWWLYDDVAKTCGQAVARQLWQTWLEGRNHVFHFFPGSVKNLTLAEATKVLEMIESSIGLALQCQPK